MEKIFFINPNQNDHDTSGQVISLYNIQPISEPEDNQVPVMDMEEMEQTLENFASVLPEALTDPELAKIVYDEAKRNEEDEPYALWSKIADRPTQGGKTLRKEIQNVLMKRALGKTIIAEQFTTAMDEVEYLQVYIHDFEDWDGGSAIQTTFTPLTINDVDVTELTMYDTLGSTYTLEVDTIPPDYPLIVVGLNESMEMSDYYSTLGKSTEISSSGYYPYITKIKLTKHPKHYEPWYAGKAELYYINYVTNTSTGHEYMRSWDGKWGYHCWKLTWRGWRSHRKWRSWNHKIDPGYPNSITGIEIWEFDPWVHDGITNDPWYVWDCDNLEDWPLIRDGANILCDLMQNIVNWGGNDDYVGGAYVSLTETEQKFEGNGIDIKMKKKWY